MVQKYKIGRDEIDAQFPAYRKYSGVDTWFKITSDRDFTEIKRVGKRYLKTDIHATQFPEMQFIRDMLECYEGRWQKVAEREFTAVNNSI